MRRLLRYSLSIRFFSSCWHLLHLHVFVSLISTSTHSPQSIHWIYFVFLTLRLFSKLFTMYWPFSSHLCKHWFIIYIIKKNRICTEKARKFNKNRQSKKSSYDYSILLHKKKNVTKPRNPWFYWIVGLYAFHKNQRTDIYYT